VPPAVRIKRRTKGKGKGIVFFSLLNGKKKKRSGGGFGFMNCSPRSDRLRLTMTNQDEDIPSTFDDEKRQGG